MKHTSSTIILALVYLFASSFFYATAGYAFSQDHHDHDVAPTATPIQYLVVIFGENNSFDHYFGTYPHATNPPGEPPFFPAPGTPPR